jgi:hypothetical protein
MTLLLGGSATEYPSAVALGIGSSTVIATQTTLLTITGCQTFTSTEYPTAQTIKWTVDFNSVWMSGIMLNEFGLKSGAGLTGSMFTRSVLPELEFDGTNEARIEITHQIY